MVFVQNSPFFYLNLLKNESYYNVVIGVARTILWGGHKLEGLLAPYYLNFSDEDSSPLTFFFAHFCVLVSVICVLLHNMRIV